MNKKYLKKSIALVIIIFLINICPIVIGNNENFEINNLSNINYDNNYLNINSPPVITDPKPYNNTIVGLNLEKLTIMIQDPHHTFNWTIQTSNHCSASGDKETDGSKTCPISGLEYDQTIKWYVNVTDGINWTRQWFCFKTIPATGYIPTIQKIIVDVVDHLGGVTFSVGIVNNYDDITQWSIKNNTVRIEWEVRNDDRLEYHGSPLVVHTRIREYQLNVVRPSFEWFKESGRIRTENKWYDINIPILSHSYTDETLIDIQFIQLNNMVMSTGSYYHNNDALSKWVISASGNRIIF